MKNETKIIKNTALRKTFGVFCIILGIVFILMPVVPGIWLLAIGLEFFGIRLLIKGKLKHLLENYWLYKKMVNIKVKIQPIYNDKQQGG